MESHNTVLKLQMKHFGREKFTNWTKSHGREIERVQLKTQQSPPNPNCSYVVDNTGGRGYL